MIQSNPGSSVIFMLVLSPMVTTLALEKEINTFFRLHSPTAIAKLRERFRDLDEDPAPKDVFLKLRELRNDW